MSVATLIAPRARAQPTPPRLDTESVVEGDSVHMAARTASFAAIALVGLALAGCGGDDDENGDSGGGATQDAEVAQQVEAHLRKDTKAFSGGSAEPGEVISTVQVTGGEVKVTTFLNGDLKPDEKPAAEICSAAKESGVEGVESVVVVDAGDVELTRC
jgi:hypothetical protein